MGGARAALIFAAASADLNGMHTENMALVQGWADTRSTLRDWSKRPGRALLIDCLTLWLNEVMMAEIDLLAAQASLLDALAASPAPIVLVSNEIGLGLVPETPLGRRFRDAQGRLNQAVAAIVPRVVFVAAGLPLWLKGAPCAGRARPP